MRTLAIALAAIFGLLAYALVTVYAMWMGLIYAFFQQWIYVGFLGALVLVLVWAPFYITRKMDA